MAIGEKSFFGKLFSKDLKVETLDDKRLYVQAHAAELKAALASYRNMQANDAAGAKPGRPGFRELDLRENMKQFYDKLKDPDIMEMVEELVAEEKAGQ